MAVFEEIGESLQKVYKWVKDKAAVVGNAIWETMGMITQKLGNSITYVISFLANDCVPAIVNFVTGLLKAGVAVAPAQAEKAIKNIADYVTEREGGNGAVRDFCNLSEKEIRLITGMDIGDDRKLRCYFNL